MVLWVCVAICKPVLPCYINKIRCLSVSIRSFLEQQEAENLTKLKYKVFYDICRWIKYFIWKKVTFILVYYYSTKFMAVMWVINWAEKIVCIYTILHGLRYIRVSACMLSCFNHVQFFVILWTVAHQGPLSIGFSRQQYWSVLPCPPPRDLPDPGGDQTLASYVSCTGRWVLYHWHHCEAWGILFPQPGIKSVSPALGAQS